MDQVFIKNLNARRIIGINDWERVNKQDIRINIILFADLQKAGESDNIIDSVNYRTVSKKVIEHAESAERYTVEALASDLVKICLAEKGVLRSRVRVEKPGAVRFSESVGVEIERGQDGS